jgi:hypothetical protein
MGFIDDDEVIGAGRRVKLIGVFENAPDHGLNRCYLHPIGRFRKFLREISHRKNLIEFQESAGLGGAHCIERLPAERVAINKKENPPEPLSP